MKKYLLFITSVGLLSILSLASFINISKPDLNTARKNSPLGNYISSHLLNRQLLASGIEKSKSPKTEKLDHATRKEVMQNISQLPLTFEKNMGQWRQEILYRASSPIAKVGFRKNGLTFLSYRELEEDDDTEQKKEEELSEKMIWNLNFKGMSNYTQILTEGEVAGVNNYLLGNDSTKWIKNTPQSKLINYKEIYDHIDLHYYGLANQKLEYDYIVKPGGNIVSIQMVLDGAGGLKINTGGELVITTPWGEVAEAKPYSYQVIAGVKKEIDIRYQILDDSTFGFKAYEAYDQNYDLVIDPKVLVWTTLIKGLNATNYVYDIGIDASRNVFITGYTDGAFDITAGVVQGTFGGTEDAFVSKFNRFGTKLLYSTYIGGANNSERAYAIAVSSGGNAYITGRTDSNDYPTFNAIFPAPQGSTDTFISALTPTGTSFIYSTYFGSGSSDMGKCAFVNSANELYVTGFGKKSSSPAFPTTAGVILTDASADGSVDAYVVKLTSTGANAFCTLLGGSGSDEGHGIYVTGTGEIYVTGITSGSFPIVGGIGNAFAGSTDAFVAKLNANVTVILYSNYLGGSGADAGEGIFVRNDEAYVTGRAVTDFPTTAGAFQTANAGGIDVFVTKLNVSGNTMVYSTFLGGSMNESASDGTRESDISVNNNGEAYVSGITASSDFPVVNGFDMSYNLGDDGFISLLNADGSNLMCSTYFGGEANDYKRLGIALDYTGIQDTLYASITTHSRTTVDGGGGTLPIAQLQGAVYCPNHVNGTDDEPVVWKMYSCMVSLPVQLVYFQGSNKGDYNLLEWTTATEKNNDYFSIERSTDGINFLVTSIVGGAGNSNSILHYSYSDPQEGEEIIYYRLKQTDTDGQIYYSKIVAVNAADNSKALELIIFSPVTDQLNYKVCCLHKGNASVEVIDLSGRVVIKSKVLINEMYNKLSLDVNMLSEGLYILKFVSDNGTAIAKFVK
jgi:hypothetical protein